MVWTDWCIGSGNGPGIGKLVYTPSRAECFIFSAAGVGLDYILPVSLSGWPRVTRVTCLLSVGLEAGPPVLHCWHYYRRVVWVGARALTNGEHLLCVDNIDIYSVQCFLHISQGKHINLLLYIGCSEKNCLEEGFIRKAMVNKSWYCHRDRGE